MSTVIVVICEYYETVKVSVASVHSVGRHLCGVLQDAPWESPISDRCRHLMEQLIKDQVFFFFCLHNISYDPLICFAFF